MDNFICGGYIFTSNFDSGNLHKVELQKWHEEALPSSDTVAIEFNLWTRPDCGGTEYENLNRSWFFFSIQGGEPNKVCKLNIVNMNKQAKLFSQGMHPVIRVGDTGKWERIKYSPVYNVQNNEFVLSFLHKPHTDITTKFYYAFTFPFTYTDCQTQLARFDTLYQKSADEMAYILRRLNVDVHVTDVDVNCNTINFERQDVVDVENMQNNFNAPATSTNCQSTSSISILESQSKPEIENDIYYHRELLINSIEGRRIDLLTITSFHNIQKENEYRFPDLFPDLLTKRCKKFKNKKVIFISSRVHPGETQSSHILNGFLKMLLDRKNRYATILRKMYVFKIIPLLNPDGVYNGHYRSDVMGHNLNRVYLTPKRETQPAIYAVRKLIRYYHNENDIDDGDDNQLQGSMGTENVENVENTIEIPQINLNNNDEDFIEESTMDIDIPSSGLDDASDIDASSRESSSEEKSIRAASVLTEINIEAKNNRNIEKIVSTPISTASTASTATTATILSPLATPSSSTESESERQQTPQQQQQHHQPKPKSSTDTIASSTSIDSEATNVNVVIQKMRKAIDSGNSVTHSAKLNQKLIIGKASSFSLGKSNGPALAGPSSVGVDAIKQPKKLKQRTALISSQRSFGQTNSLPSSSSSSSSSSANRDCCSDSSGRYSNSATTIDSARSGKKKEPTIALNGTKLNTGNNTTTNKPRINRKLAKTEIDSMPKTPASGCSSTRSAKRSTLRKHSLINAAASNFPTNLNISAEFCKDPNNRINKREDQSNMFLYIDLHGHASKKGIFMYGNYLPNIAESVECMLLPRLMSLNSHHFHFDACVFSERNMYHKGKRDGLSKEGSGRVAIYKTIGLIKSYTLEGNYNTGKYVNILPPREKEINQRKICTIPPKYTPVIYEEVGRALGPSILDLTESNPSSRLRASEFRSLQGLRNALRNDIERGLLKAEPLQKAATSQIKSKSLKPPTACSSSLTTDVCKENKDRHTTTSSTNTTTSTASTNKAPISYGKKEKSTNLSLGQRKKGKILCDVMASTSTGPPIPTKRQKVITTKKCMSFNKSDAIKESVPYDLKSNDVHALSAIESTSLIEAGDELTVFVDKSMTVVTTTAATIATAATTSSPTTAVAVATAAASAFNPDIPCCSYQSSTSFNPFKYPNAPKKSSNFLRKSTTSNEVKLTSMMTINTSMVPGKKVKSAAIKLRGNSFSAGASGVAGVGGPTNNGSRLKSSLRKSSLTKDGRRMKKKKSLKADTGLKRKKPKVF